MSLSIRARLTLWVVVLMTAALTAFGAGVLWLQVRWTRAELDAGLVNVVATAARMIDEEFSENGNLPGAVNEARGSLNVPGLAMAVLDGQGRPMAAHWHGFDYQRIAESWRRPEQAVFQTATVGNAPWRVLLEPQTTPGGAYTLMVARPMDEIARERSVLKRVLLVAGSIVVLITGIISWWVASSALRPVTLMAQQAHAMTADAIDWRLGGASGADELGQLARAFNGLVARLRHALQTQRQFMADASHELRTPVSVIQTTADVTLARDSRAEADYRDAIATVGGEARRLGRLVDDMLVLARADAGGYPLRRENLYLNELVTDCGRTVDVLARERGVTIRASTRGDVPFFGDESLLRRMVLNLLQNAVAHTREGSAIEVEVAPNGSRVWIRVKDEGEGIADADRARIFDRFVQVDPARHRAGAGLGLPIARWIAEIHGGSLDLEESGRGGSTFRVVLPLSEG